MKNNDGSRIDLCRTPAQTLIQDELWPLSTSLRFLLLKKSHKMGRSFATNADLLHFENKSFVPHSSVIDKIVCCYWSDISLMQDFFLQIVFWFSCPTFANTCYKFVQNKVAKNSNPLSAILTKWSNTPKQFVGNSLRIVWVCLTIFLNTNV